MTLRLKINDQYQSEEVMKEYLNLVIASFNETEREAFNNMLDTVLGNDGELTMDIHGNDDGSVDYYCIMHRVIPADAGTEET